MDIDEAFARFEEAHYDYIATYLETKKNGKAKHVILKNIATEK